MTKLNLKLLRDALAAKWQFVAISFVTALGVATYHGSMTSYERQKASYQLSYDRLLFGDVWIGVRRAPRAVVPTIARMPGVVAVEGRVSEYVELEQEPPRRPRAIGRVFSVPTGRPLRVNQLLLVAGKPIGQTSRREVWLDWSFARANRYQPGDRIFLRFSGRRVAFRIAGIVCGPEFIYPVMGGTLVLPLPEVLGAMYVAEDVIAPLLGTTGQITEVVLRTEPNKSEEVARAVHNRLKAYGPQTPILRPEQPSNKLLQSDLEGNKPFLIVMPSLFLASAAVATGIMLARWVQVQRSLIGFLRASGFSARTVLFHYLGAGLTLGACGGSLGVVLGRLLGMWMAAAYERVIRTPLTATGDRPDIALTAFALAVASCLAGAWLPARAAARIAPAEAMRGAVPSQPGAIARLRLRLFLAIATRNFVRRPLRTLGTASGVASAVCLMIIAGSFRDSMKAAIAESTADFQRYDITAVFVPERSASIVRAIRSWPGVRAAEETLDVPVRASRGEAQKETVVMGYVRDSRLRLLHDMSGRPVKLEEGVAYYSDLMASRLRSEPGDTIRLDYIQNIHGRSATAHLRTGPRLRLPVPLPIYVEMQTLRRLFARRLWMPPDAVGGAVVAVQPGYENQIMDRLHHTDGVGLVLGRKDVTRQIDEVTAFANTFIAIMYLLGAAMAFAVVYIVTDVVLWERTRELATMRTLGFGMLSILRLVTLENLLLGATGSILALFPAYRLAQYLMQAANTEGFVMTLAVTPQTYAMAVGGALVAVLIAQWPGLRRVQRLDLADAIRLTE